MSVSPKLQLKVKQKLQLAPQVRQAMGLMQLTRLELIAHIQQVAESNPLIDLDTLHSANDAASLWNQGQVDARSRTVSDNDPMQWVVDTSHRSLAEHLRWQASQSGFSAIEHALALGIIDHIDERGLLSASVGEITKSLNQSLESQTVDVAQVNQVLEKVQRFDPIGVGAATLQDALRTQLLIQYPTDPRYGLANHLVLHHFEQLGQGNLTTLANLLEIDQENLKSAFELIHSLNPHPGAGFGGLDSNHIIPDLYIHPSSDAGSLSGWQVIFNSAHIPTVRLNDTYDQLIKKAHGTDRQYLDTKRKEATTLIEALALRHQTLVHMTTALVAHQSDFLREGPRAMRALTQTELAEKLGVHVSTISRTCNGKYAQTPQGVIELKSLFCREIMHQTKGVLANAVVKEHIRDLIDQEDKLAPLSDQAIATHLASIGVKIARRTVTKYRETMGINGSAQRRNMHNWTH